MAKQWIIQTNFNAGEWAPRLMGRVDLQQYPQACRKLRNAVLYPQGGAKARPGFIYVASSKDSSKRCRLIPFIYSNAQAYTMEFGDGYIRFFMDDGQILSGGSPYEIASPYGEDELRTLQFKRCGDVLYITHPDYPPRKLSRSGHAAWTLTQLELLDGPYLDMDLTSGISLTPSAKTGSDITIEAEIYGSETEMGTWLDTALTPQAGLTTARPYIGFRFTAAGGKLYTVAFSVATGAGTGSNLPSRCMLYADSSGSPSGDAVGASDDVDVDASGSKIYTFSGHPKLSAGTVYWLVLKIDTPTDGITFNTVAHNESYGSGYATSVATLADDLETEWNVEITYLAIGNADLFDSGHVGALFRLQHTGSHLALLSSGSSPSGSIMLRGAFIVDLSPSTDWIGHFVVQRSKDNTNWFDYADFYYSTKQEFFESEETGAWYRIRLENMTDGKGRLTISQSEHWGTVRITSVTNAHKANAEVLYELGGTDSTPFWREGAFSDYQGYPAAVEFRDDRLEFGGTLLQPQTRWASWVDDYPNFSPGDTDNAPITTTLNEMNNPIQWMNSDVVLLLGSIGEIVTVTGQSDKPETETNAPIVKIQSNKGSALATGPIRAGGALIYLQTARRKIRQLNYTYSSDKFESTDLTLLAEHLTKSGIVEYAYQDEPDSILWCVRADGKMAALTYYPEEKVMGWSLIETDGKFESVCCIPSTLGNKEGRDEVWVSVRRTINGETRRTIELLANHAGVTDLKDYFCVDCGLTYDGDSTTSISGLSHLEGKTVAILADGGVETPQVVSNGAITLDTAASVVHVGLPYTATLQPMPLEGGTQDGTSQGRMKQINRVVLRFLETLGGKVGPDEDNLLPIPNLAPDSQLMNNPPPLFTGDVEIPWGAGSSRDASVVVVQDQPLPMTLLGMIVEMSTDG